MLAGLSQVLQSEAFCQEHRVDARAFTRRRCLTLPVLVVFLLQLMGAVALQPALDGFFMALRGSARCVRTVTKSALSQARRKLKASAFVALNRLWVQGWHESVAFERWRGWRVLVADGTCLRLPHLRENIDTYGLGPCKDGSVAMCRCVALWAAASRQWLEVIVGRYDQGERELLLRALEQIRPDDLLLLDRGYPAWWLFAALRSRSVAFCARIEGCGWTAAHKLLRSSSQDCVMHHHLTAKERRTLQALGLVPPQRLSLRLVKVCLPNGRLQVLVTSLMDTQEYPAQDFGELYRRRWGIEEEFKLAKHRQHLEGFSGELPQSIEQDIQARIVLHNIVQAVCHQAQQSVPPHQQGQWQVNRAYAVQHVGRVVVAWFRSGGRAWRLGLRSLIGVLSRTLERLRPGRSFARHHAPGGAQRPRKSYRSGGGLT